MEITFVNALFFAVLRAETLSLTCCYGETYFSHHMPLQFVNNSQLLQNGIYKIIPFVCDVCGVYHRGAADVQLLCDSWVLKASTDCVNKMKYAYIPTLSHARACIEFDIVVQHYAYLISVRKVYSACNVGILQLMFSNIDG